MGPPLASLWVPLTTSLCVPLATTEEDKRDGRGEGRGGDRRERVLNVIGRVFRPWMLVGRRGTSMQALHFLRGEASILSLYFVSGGRYLGIVFSTRGGKYLVHHLRVLYAGRRKCWKEWKGAGVYMLNKS